MTTPARTVACGGLQVHVRMTGSGPAVLLLHGNASSSAWWEPTLHRVPASYTWVAPDLRGRGETVGPAAGWTIEQLAADARRLLDALGLETAHVVGHSLGANVAMQLALDQHARVRSLCLLNPGWVAGDIPAAMADDARLVALADAPQLLRGLLRGVAPLHPENAAWEKLVAASLTQTRDATLGGGRVYRHWRVDGRLRELAGIPTTVVRGQGDLYLSSAALCEGITAAIPGATLKTLANATHSPNVEAPHAWVAALLEHLQKT